MQFICGACREGQHGNCPGGTHCDCQHRSKVLVMSVQEACNAFYLIVLPLWRDRLWMSDIRMITTGQS